MGKILNPKDRVHFPLERSTSNRGNHGGIDPTNIGLATHNRGNHGGIDPTNIGLATHNRGNHGGLPLPKSITFWATDNRGNHGGIAPTHKDHCFSGANGLPENPVICLLEDGVAVNDALSYKGLPGAGRGYFGGEALTRNP